MAGNEVWGAVHYAVDLAPLGDLADPRVLVRLAEAAERAGWDGVSTWDVLGTAMDAAAAEPFVALAGIAAATEHLRLITSVIILPRRRPQLVAQAAATLDVLSGGRLVLGIGAGADPLDFTAFGEPFDGARVARMDADAAQVDEWLRGMGDHPVGPRTVQQPRPPVWVGGSKPGALRRAARWDGWIAVATSEDYASLELAPADLAVRVRQIREERARLDRSGEDFDVALFAYSEPGDAATPAAYAAAGATWWLESLSLARGSVDALLARIEAGPPRA